MKIESFNVDRVIGITIIDKRKSHYKWLPKKQKTFLVFKLNKYHEEGYYSHGCYKEGYMDDSWDNTPVSEKDLIAYGYLVDSNTKTVYHRPVITIYLQDDCTITVSYDTLEEAIKYSESIQSESTRKFITI